jgi:Undecaprenyl-phosphate galactose phosphotransferase WbaP
MASTLSIRYSSLWHVSLSKRAVLLGDIVAVILTFILATLLNLMLERSPLNLNLAVKWFYTQNLLRYWVWLGLGFLALVIFLFRFQHYVNRRPFWDELSDVLKTIGTLALIDMSLVAITRWNASRLWWLFAWCLMPVAIIFIRRMMRLWLNYLGLWARTTILVGHGQNAKGAIEALMSEPHLGYALKGYVNVDAQNALDSNESANTLTFNDLNLPEIHTHDLQALAKQPGIQWVLALDHSQYQAREHWLRQLSQWGAQEICVIPDMRGIPLYGTHMSYFFSHEVTILRIRNNLKRWPTRLTKRLFDAVVASVLLIFFSPLFLYLFFAIKKDGGPAFFKQTRIGKRGKVFQCFKFRTMVADAPERLQDLLERNPELRAEWELDHKIKNDPRVTQLGVFLRRTSLDEAPQLLNVLKGEMSLVGPRPIVKAELEKYGDDIEYFLMVRPGMTGLWQVSGRSDMSYDKRVYLDTWYVKNWSLWYDLVILFKTVNVVIARNGAY